MRHLCEEISRTVLLLGLVWTAVGCSGNTPEDTSDIHLAELPGGGTMAFVPVPADTFLMGSPVTEPARDDDEGPVHRVIISHPFYIGRTEVTQAQWEAVMGTRPWAGKRFVKSDADRPAVYVSWFDATEMAARLNAWAGAQVYRLPTEAEWEYACRAGSRGRWSFGDNPEVMDQHGWHTGNTWDVGLRAAQPVATLQPNALGLYDMHGNVSEWVADWYGPDYYARSPLCDPAGPASGAARVFRGGYFHNDGVRRLRSANRMYYRPDATAASVGFRLVREME